MPIFQDCRREGRDFGLGGEVCGVDYCFAAQCFYSLEGCCVRVIPLKLVRTCSIVRFCWGLQK